MNKYIKALKMTLKVLGIIFGLFIGGVTLYVGYLYYELIEPFKVTNPDNKWFNPYKFEFDDYFGQDDRITAMQKIFYVGMPREEVEKIIVGGGARADMNDPRVKYYLNEYHYVWRNLMGNAWVFKFQYDQNNKLIRAKFSSSTIIVPSPYNPKRKVTE